MDMMSTSQVDNFFLELHLTNTQAPFFLPMLLDVVSKLSALIQFLTPHSDNTSIITSAIALPVPDGNLGMKEVVQFRSQDYNLKSINLLIPSDIFHELSVKAIWWQQCCLLCCNTYTRNT